jgi:inosose dehydratase
VDRISSLPTTEQPTPAPLTRLAGAPISWGVCEVPGWGEELPPDRVLGEMRGLGLRATEFGPVGYFGDSPREVRERLDRHGLELVGGFLPVVLHDAVAQAGSLELARSTAELYAACGGTLLVSAVVLDAAWSPPRDLDGQEWRTLLDGLARLDELAVEHGLEHVLHPHAGSLVERAVDVERVLGDSSIRLCLDTGHLAIGGADPLALVNDAFDRIGHVHLKDVDGEVALRLRGGELGLVEAVQHGLFRPLGDGDVPVADVVAALARRGYYGWLVLEQDTALDAVPRAGGGPVDDVRRSIDFLRSIDGAGRVAQTPGGRTKGRYG